MDCRFSSREFRDALGCFATGVAVATTVDASGSPVGVTINSFASVSLEPALVLFSLDRRSANLDAFISGRAFGINILTVDQQALSNRFAGPDTDRWKDVAWFSSPTEQIPLLADSLAQLECALHANHDGGDHVILVGRVVGLASYGATDSHNPLVYYRGRYASLR